MFAALIFKTKKTTEIFIAIFYTISEKAISATHGHHLENGSVCTMYPHIYMGMFVILSIKISWESGIVFFKCQISVCQMCQKFKIPWFSLKSPLLTSSYLYTNQKNGTFLIFRGVPKMFSIYSIAYY